MEQQDKTENVIIIFVSFSFRAIRFFYFFLIPTSAPARASFCICSNHVGAGGLKKPVLVRNTPSANLAKNGTGRGVQPS